MRDEPLALQARWTAAVESYRRSVDLYRRVLELRAQYATRQRLQDPFQPAPKILIDARNAPPTASAVTALDVLTPREHEVASLIARGLTNQQIATRLVVTRGTVANHVAHILSKLGLANRTQVAAYVTSERAPATNGHLSA